MHNNRQHCMKNPVSFGTKLHFACAPITSHFVMLLARGQNRHFGWCEMRKGLQTLEFSDPRHWLRRVAAGARWGDFVSNLERVGRGAATPLRPAAVRELLASVRPDPPAIGPHDFVSKFTSRTLILHAPLRFKRCIHAFLRLNIS